MKLSCSLHTHPKKPKIKGKHFHIYIQNVTKSKAISPIRHNAILKLCIYLGHCNLKTSRGKATALLASHCCPSRPLLPAATSTASKESKDQRNLFPCLCTQSEKSHPSTVHLSGSHTVTPKQPKQAVAE